MVQIKQSKMDLFSQGVTLRLVKTDCAISFFYWYRALLDSKGILSRLFVHHQQRSLYDKTIFSHSAVYTPCQAGLPRKQFNTHSFRKEAATSVKAAHVSDVHIQATGQWRSNANELYIKTPSNRQGILLKVPRIAASPEIRSSKTADFNNLHHTCD